MDIDASIFRSYDIRGAVGRTLTSDAVRSIGRSFGTEALRRGHRKCVLGGDVRLSTPSLRTKLTEGVRSTGLDVVDIGVVTTPIMYFAAESLGEGAGLMITGSHNPPQDNGIKMVLEHRALMADEIQSLRLRIRNEDYALGRGKFSTQDISDRYIERVSTEIEICRPLKVVGDFGNGCAGIHTPIVLERLGCELIPLYARPDGRFPNHHPDPARPENVSALRSAVLTTRADVGIAFDGDGDRLGVLDERGRQIWPDRLLMLLAEAVLRDSPQKTPVVFDVKCSSNLRRVIESLGGTPVMCRTGHTWTKARMRETEAPLGGEFSGHICFADRWNGTDDATYAACRLLELVASSEHPASALFDRFPNWQSEPELLLEVSESDKFRIVDELVHRSSKLQGCVTAIDGVRIDQTDSWALVRASNTAAHLSLRFEGRTSDDLARTRSRMLQELVEIYPALRAQFRLRSMSNS